MCSCPDFLLGKAIEGDSHILFLSPRSCVFCLLWETFEFVLLERSHFGPRIPSLGAFILETVAERLFCAGTCGGDVTA